MVRLEGLLALDQLGTTVVLHVVAYGMVHWLQPYE